MREQFAATTTDLLNADRSIALVLADISEQYFEEALLHHPEWVFNLGIREQFAVNVGRRFGAGRDAPDCAHHCVVPC